VTQALKAFNRVSRASRPPSPCGECGSPVNLLPGPHGLFIGCSRYPLCRETRNDLWSDRGEALAKQITAHLAEWNEADDP